MEIGSELEMTLAVVSSLIPTTPALTIVNLMPLSNYPNEKEPWITHHSKILPTRIFNFYWESNRWKVEMSSPTSIITIASISTLMKKASSQKAIEHTRKYSERNSKINEYQKVKKKKASPHLQINEHRSVSTYST